MSTPNVPASSIETGSPSSDLSGPVPGDAPRVGSGGLKEVTDGHNWSNVALFSIGGVAAIGLVIVLSGAYLVKPESVTMIVAGTVILMLAVIAWIFTALAMIGSLIWRLITSRGKKARKRLPKQQ